MTQTSITVSGPISFATQYRATRAVVTRARYALAYGFFIGVPVLCLVFAMAKGRDLTRPSVLGFPTWFALLLGPLFAFVFLPLIRVVSVWQRRRKNISIRGVLTFVVGPEGFESHGETFDVKLRWNAIHRVMETREFLFFYIAAGAAHFIPKACIPSPSELQAIRTIIREALHKRAKLQTT
jgi:hypothetical protein